MAKAQFHERHSYHSIAVDDSKQDPNGRLFVSKAGMFDLSKVAIIGCTVDTVRQLYTGTIKSALYDRIKQAVDSELYRLDGAVFHVPCSWAVSRMSKVSGYRYKLQNNEEGVVILVGSYYALEEDQGSHLKIELSPRFIASRGHSLVQVRLDQIANSLLDQPAPAGCAVHLAMDIQQWMLPADFEDRFSTYSRAKRGFDGIVESQFVDLATASTRYGKNEIETLTYGKPAGLQACIYRKDKEIIRSDKVDYFHGLWAESGQFDPEEPVWRVEMRFHHTVVREIGNGMGEALESFAQVARHLADMWRYALMRNRLDHSSRYIAPIWQLFIEEARFLEPANGLKLARVKKKDVAAISKNLGQIIGNLISLSARQGHNTRFVMLQLRKLFIWPEIQRYYRERGMTEDDLRQQVEKGLWQRRVLGKAA